MDHLRQSVRDILTTPLGSRVMRRDYGSEIFDLIDAPINRGTILDIIAASVDALRRCEPRLLPQRVQVESFTPGSLVVAVTALEIESGATLNLPALVIQ